MFFQQFAARFPYVGDYICLDIETSGLQPGGPVQICTIGHVEV